MVTYNCVNNKRIEQIVMPEKGIHIYRIVCEYRRFLHDYVSMRENVVCSQVNVKNEEGFLL